MPIKSVASLLKAPALVTKEKQTASDRNFNDVLRSAKSAKVDVRGGDKNLMPHVEIILKDGRSIIVSANDDKGVKIGWAFEDESDAP